MREKQDDSVEDAFEIYYNRKQELYKEQEQQEILEAERKRVDGRVRVFKKAQEKFKEDFPQDSHLLEEKYEELVEDMKQNATFVNFKDKIPREPYDDPIENVLSKKEKIREELKELFKIADKIKIDMLLEMLGISREFFYKHVIEWAQEIHFRINGEYLEIIQLQLELFEEQLDNEFSQWEQGVTEKKT